MPPRVRFSARAIQLYHFGHGIVASKAKLRVHVVKHPHRPDDMIRYNDGMEPDLILPSGYGLRLPSSDHIGISDTLETVSGYDCGVLSMSDDKVLPWSVQIELADLMLERWRKYRERAEIGLREHTEPKVD